MSNSGSISFMGLDQLISSEDGTLTESNLSSYGIIYAELNDPLLNPRRYPQPKISTTPIHEHLDFVSNLSQILKYLVSQMQVNPADHIVLEQPYRAGLKGRFSAWTRHEKVAQLFADYSNLMDHFLPDGFLVSISSQVPVLLDNCCEIVDPYAPYRDVTEQFFAEKITQRQLYEHFRAVFKVGLGSFLHKVLCLGEWLLIQQALKPKFRITLQQLHDLIWRSFLKIQ